MNYEKFKQIIDLQIAHNKRSDELYALKIDLLETFDEITRANDCICKRCIKRNT